MATLIQIKRGTGTAGPSPDLARESELAYAQDTTNDGTGAKLYIQSIDSAGLADVHAVGGKFYTDLTDAHKLDLDAATHSKTANELARRDSTGSIEADVIGNLTGNASGTASAWATARKITLAGDVSGEIVLDGSGDVTSTNLQVTGAIADQVTGDVKADNGQVVVENGTDGTDATFRGDILSNDGLVTILDSGTDGTDAEFTGDVTGNLDGIVGGTTPAAVTGTTITANTGFAGALTGNVIGNVTGDLTGNSAGTHTGAVVGNASTATALETARAISVTGDATGTANFDGSAAAEIAMTLADTAVTPNAYGSTTEVPVLTIDSKGRITAASTETISTALTIADAASGGNEDIVAGGETLVFLGTDNEIETTVSNNQVQIGLPTNPTIGGHLTVSGNLTVAGTTTTVDSAQVTLKDSLLKYADANTGDSVDVGFFGETDSDTTSKYHGLFRDANDGKFKMFKDLEEAPSTTVNTTGTGYTVATIVANLEGDLAGNVLGNVTGNLTGNVTGDVTGDIYASNGAKVLENGDGTNASYTGSLTGGRVSGLSQAIDVADGGTGAVTHAVNGIMIGNGTSAMTTITGTLGQIMTCDANGVPSFGNLDGGVF